MPPVLCPTLVGRDRELEVIEGGLDRLISGTGGVLFISGEAGIGKTRLLRAASEEAREREIRVLTGRVPQSGSGIPLHPVAEALQSSITDAELAHPSLEMYGSTLSRLIGLPVKSGLPDPSLLASMEAALRALRVMSSQTPVLLLIEDIHAADLETLATIEYLSDRLTSERIACIATERSDTGAEATALVSTLVARRAAEHIVLAPLSSEQVDEMTRRALDVDSVPQNLLDALTLRVEGVPFLVEEMLGAYVSAAGPIERRSESWVSARIAEGVPHSYREVVRSRLASLEESSRTVVFSAAILGRAFDWKVLAHVTDLSHEQVLDALRAAVAANILASGGDHFATGFGFRHALTREAVLAELLEPERTALSLKTARAIEAVHPDLPGDLCNRAALLYEEGGALLDAVRLLQEIARRALARSALDSAEAALLHASELTPDDWMVWMGTDDLLLDVYSLAGKNEGLLERGKRLLDGFQRYEGHVLAPRQSRFHLKIARGLLLGGDLDSCVKHLDHAERLAGMMEDESVRPQVETLRGEVAFATGNLDAATRFGELALESATRLHLTATRCEALDMLARIALAEGDTIAAAESASTLNSLADDPKLVVWKIRALLHQGSVDGLTRGDVARLELARNLALATGAVSVLAAIELQIAWAHLGRGSFEAATPHIDRAVEISQLYALSLLWETLAARCTAFALAGDPVGVEAAETEARRAAADQRSLATIHASGRGTLALARGDDDATLRHLDEALALAPIDAPEWWRGLHRLLEVALRNRSRPTEEPTSLASRHPTIVGYHAYGDAIAHGRTGDHEAALVAFNRAEESMPPGWRRHHARRMVADAALEDGWGDPVEWATEAVEYFDGASLKGFMAAARATLRRGGAPVRRRGRGESVVPEDLSKLGITSREMDVLKLIGERLSNREIGSRLFVSPRTVESHVASLQRKTAADSRAELVELGRRHLEPLPSGTEA